MRGLLRLGGLGVVGALTAGLLVVAGPATPARAAEFYAVPASGAYTLDGHGYGHGWGMSQWGAQGAAMSGVGAADILAFYYPGTVQHAIGDPVLKVQLRATPSGDVRLDSTPGQAMTVRDVATGLSRTGPAGAYRVLTSGDTQRVVVHDGVNWVDFSLGGAGSYAGPLTFSTPDGVTVYKADADPTGPRWTTARNYRGFVQVVRTSATVSTAVNHVTMEDYLKGVVPRESPAWFEPAALQAQAVAARSYSWYDVAVTPGTSWDTCDTTACQVYGGRMLYQNGSWTGQEEVATTNAIAVTAGIALYYDGSPAFTQFSASNGGARVAGSRPYLAAGPDPYDGIPPKNSNHNWTATLSAAYLQSTYPEIGTLTGIRVVSRTGVGEWGGHITSFEVVGTAGTARPSARLNLKSTWWKPRPSGEPFGDVNSVQVDSTKVRLTGWTIDPDTSDPTDVHVYVGEDWGGSYRADVPRTDVGAAYPGKGDRHGFDITLRAAAGVRTVCVYAINLGAGTSNPRIGCREVVLGHPPVGSLDAATRVADKLRLTGWTIDPDTPDPIPVHAYVNGRYARAVTADVPRADVGRVYPASGPNHGYDTTVTLVPGTNTVCLYAVNTPEKRGNRQLGCRTVVYGALPVGDVHSVSVSGSQVRVAGWALDPDTTESIDVHVYVDGALAAVAVADRSRTDVGQAFPGYGARHGYDLTLPAAAGRHQVCVYAINVRVGSVNPRLGCATAMVAGPHQPTGNIDSSAVSGTSVTLSGWALDLDRPTTPIDVHLYVDGRWGGSVTASQSRPDVGAAYPAAGNAHGWTATMSAGPGTSRICAYGINVGGGTNALLRCVDVRVS
jgi:SpoIID/LytB domain protein